MVEKALEKMKKKIQIESLETQIPIEVKKMCGAE
jgi:hypothetical protein